LPLDICKSLEYFRLFLFERADLVLDDRPGSGNDFLVEVAFFPHLRAYFISEEVDLF
jgi:hypothetical protein